MKPVKKPNNTAKVVATSAELLVEGLLIITFASLVLAISALLLAPTAQADEAALYDKAPEGSAFVRLINATGAPLSVKIGDKQLKAAEHCQASDYIYLAQGKYKIDSAAAQWQGDLKQDKAYTLVVSNNGTTAYEQELFRDARKGLLAVYNLSSQPLSVITTRGNKPVFPNMPAKDYNARKVNPIKIQLSIRASENSAQAAEAVIFQPGITSSLLVCDDAGQAESQLISHWVNH